MSNSEKPTSPEIMRMVKNNEITPEEAVQTYAPSRRTYSSSSYEERRANLAKNRAIRAEIRLNKVPFITPSFLPDFYLSQGLILVGAESGKSKSTTAANILAGFLKSPGKTAIVITNEEATDAVIERIACIMCEVSFTDFYNHRLAEIDQQMVYDTCDDILRRVEVVEQGKWDTAYIEDVEAVLESAAKGGVGMVLIDYLQTVTMSRLNPEAESFHISKKLGFYLKDYGKKYGVPVIVMAQLSGSSEGKGMAERVQNDKTFYNHAFYAIEVTPDFATLTTTFKVHKARFGDFSGKEVVMQYAGGRYFMGGL